MVHTHYSEKNKIKIKIKPMRDSGTSRSVVLLCMLRASAHSSVTVNPRTSYPQVR